MLIRDWQPGDEAAVDALLEPAADPLWAVQSHRLHGERRDGPRRRRTLVAVEGRELVAAATVAANRLHSGRLWGAIEVAVGHRRQGLGRVLLDAIRDLRPAELPIAGKVRPGSPADAFVTAVGGTVFQRCRGVQVDAGDPALRHWCANVEPVDDVTVGPVTGLDTDTLVAAFAEMYRWVHEDWLAVTVPAALADVSADIVAAADRSLTTGAWTNGRLAATSWVTRRPDGTLEIFAETQRRDEPRGTELLAMTVACSLTAAADAGLGVLEFDGHVTDPHLATIVDSSPHIGLNPLLLVEIP